MSTQAYAVREGRIRLAWRIASAGAAAVLASGTLTAHTAEGDATRGGRHFRACLACHSIAPGEHLTGPSLYGVLGKKAGTAPGFQRYSPALKSSNVVWNAETLDTWLANPERFIPNNWMTFRGIDDREARTDLIAFLRTVAAKDTGDASVPQKPRASARLPNLKGAKPDSLVKGIEYCPDAYRVKTASGEEHVFWEFNLRLKTDSSANGPEKGKPVLVGAGMQGDRASVIFSDPGEISTFIRRGC